MTASNTTNKSTIFDAYFELVEDSSESPFLYHRWNLISTVAALLGRQVHLKFGFEDIYPNMYICLMGGAGTRKSSSISISRKVLAATGYNKFARERSSKEKFIKDLSVGFDVINGAITGDDDPLNVELDDFVKFEDRDPSEVFVCAGELEDFLGNGDTAFISLLTNMWDNLPHYSHGKMTSADLLIKEPTVNLLGGCTPVTFSTVFPPEVIGQGMLSRLLLIYGGGVRKKITIPAQPNAELLSFFCEHMASIKNQVKGVMLLDDDALKVVDTIYQKGVPVDDVRLESFNNRRLTHLLKLCMVLAALELETTITKDIVIEANTILHYTEQLMPKALGEFGKSSTGDKAAIVLQALQQAVEATGDGLSLQKLFQTVSTHFDSRNKDFAEVIAKLRESGKIEIGSAPLHRLRPLHKNTKATMPYVEFETYLREYRDERRTSNTKS